MGDWAGGNLAASITQRRRTRRGEPKLLGQVLLYPSLQFSDLQTFSYHYIDPYSVAFFYLLYAGVDVNALPDFIEAALSNGHVNYEERKHREQYMNYSLLPDAFRYNSTETLKETQPINELADFLTPLLTDPDFAPLMQTDLSGLPSALVVTNEFDVLRDEGTMYARRLEAAGGLCTLTTK
ncbi:hypothetical protein PRIPAC_77007 [Pristionchus pacificus]|nr:hypothetical protein PRIPAC_77007 [Pristionchus pacificus]